MRIFLVLQALCCVHLVLVVALLAGGCADFRGMPAVDIPLPEKFEQQPTGGTPEKLRADWWTHTGDATLLSILQALETQNLSLEQARYRLNAARLRSTRYNVLPNFTVGTNVQYDILLQGRGTIGDVPVRESGDEKATSYYDAGLDASWELPLYGQLATATGIDDAGIAFAQADVDAVRASVSCEAIRLYAELRARQQEVAECRAICASAQAVAEYQRMKLAAGLIGDDELGKGRQAHIAAQDELHRAENEVVARLHQLANLLGATRPDAAWQAPGAVPSFVVPPFDDTPLDVLRNRPDIRKAEALLLAAAGEFERSKSELYPKLAFSGRLARLGNLSGSPLVGDIVQFSGIPAITLPLFDWGKRLAAAKIQDEKLAEQGSAYRQTVIAAMHEVEEYWSAYRTAQAAEKTAEENARIARKARDHAGLLFGQGISDGIAMQTVAMDASRAAITELRAKAETIARLTALTKALGAPLAGANGAPHE